MELNIYNLESILKLSSKFFRVFLERLSPDSSELRLAETVSDLSIRDRIAKLLAKRTRTGHDDVILKRTFLTNYPYFDRVLDITYPGSATVIKLRRRLSTLGINPSFDRVTLMGQLVNLLIIDPINYPVTKASDIDAMLGLSDMSPITVVGLDNLPDEFLQTTVSSSDSGLETIFRKIQDTGSLTSYKLVFLAVPGKLEYLADVTDTGVMEHIDQIEQSANSIVTSTGVTKGLIDSSDFILQEVAHMRQGLIADPRTAGLFAFIVKASLTSNKVNTMTIIGDDTSLEFDYKIYSRLGDTYRTSYPEYIKFGIGPKTKVQHGDQGIMTMYHYSLQHIASIRSLSFNVGDNVNPIHTNRQLTEFNKYFM